MDPIENEDDRKKAVLNINNLLEKADRSYKQLQAYKPTLEVVMAFLHGCTLYFYCFTVIHYLLFHLLIYLIHLCETDFLL